ncbi:MAG: hypothetical protein V4773_21390 [Verrucomicrobiota bacterium]
MGNFYINVAVKGVSTARLREKLAELFFPTILIPDIEGHAFIYADFFGSGDGEAPSRLARALSEEPGAQYAVQCLNADDDVLMYEFWKDGARVDAYYSNPEMFQADETDAEAPRGDPGRLKSVFPFINEAEVQLVLESEEYIFAYERHQELFRLLRIPTAPAIMDFNYLQNGEVPEGVEERQLIRIGA